MRSGHQNDGIARLRANHAGQAVVPDVNEVDFVSRYEARAGEDDRLQQIVAGANRAHAGRVRTSHGPPSAPIVWQLEHATFWPKKMRRPRPTSPPAVSSGSSLRSFSIRSCWALRSCWKSGSASRRAWAG